MVVEVVASVSEVLIALAALGFALLIARHESASRERIEQELAALRREKDQKQNGSADAGP
jgi:hypothetical protein